MKDMYCPLCGNKMEIVAKDVDHEDFENDEDGDVYDESIHWGCPVKHCFTENDPLIQHNHPWLPIEDSRQNLLWTKPGNSWSLTFRE